MRGQVLDKAQQRIAWLRVGGLFVCLVLTLRAAHLTVDNERLIERAIVQLTTELRLSPSRGAIVDRDGRELALTTRAASVYAIPKVMEDRVETARQVALALGLRRADVEKRFVEHENFLYVARWVEAAKAEKLRALDLEGIGIDPEPRRSYPSGKLAAALIGFADIEGKGVRGVEQIEDDWLKGEPRTIRVQRDARGRTLAFQSTDPREVEGGEVALTLDSVMQGAAEAALAETVAKFHAKGGLVLTLDPNNGDVLALAEAPGFDPNRFREIDYARTRARTFLDAVEAGSTMKVFLAASALDQGDVDESTLLDTGEGWIHVPGKTIKDRDPFGVLTPADVLRVSSNVGAVQIAQRMGPEAQHRGLVGFGFGSKTGSRFPMEAAGILRPWQRWKPVDQATVAFGQGLSVTPIQLGVALAALGNDGLRMQPRIVLARRRRSQDGWVPTEVVPAGQAISPIAARRTLDMMETVVSPTGTGRLAGLAGVAVAGKTGTAQKLDAHLGRYSNDKYIAWFIGLVPADEPELAIVVAIDEPKGHLHSGGMVAAPLFARVAAAQLARRHIVTEPAPIAPPPPTVIARVAPADAPAAAPVLTKAPAPAEARAARVPTVSAGPATKPAAAPARTAAAAAPAPASRSTEPDHALPPRAAIAAPPARPAAAPAAGPPPSPVARATATDGLGPRPRPLAAAALEPVFVPDFLGRTISSARRIAASESLEIAPTGAVDGRVVSQTPVAGTVIHGADRTVRLRFAGTREEG
ncbi:MAG: penicillin-binding transpeptidase domain-containing protein [Myxococcota bacterium]